MDLILHIESVFDESSGRFACGVVLTDATAARAVHEGGYLLGPLSTPHAADYRALIQGLELAMPLSPHQAEIRCGSQRLVNQITGVEPLACDGEDLGALYEQAVQSLLTLDTWRIGRVDRSENERAVRLARAALERGSDVVDLDRDESPALHKREHTGVPQWTVELLDEPGTDCPARCHESIKYAFGPDTPAGFCVHAAAASLTDGPLHWPDPEQKRMTTFCPHCDVLLQISLVE